MREIRSPGSVRGVPGNRHSYRDKREIRAAATARSFHFQGLTPPSSPYATADKDALSLLQGLDFVPVQRNIGIDAFLKISNESSLVPVRVQRQGEALSEAANKLYRATKSKKATKAILIRTHEDIKLLFGSPLPESIIVVDAPAFQIKAISMVKLKAPVKVGKG